MFRFIHTADLHLDAPLHSLALKDEGLSDLVGSATRGALEQIVSLCLEEDVDALLIAGERHTSWTVPPTSSPRGSFQAQRGP